MSDIEDDSVVIVGVAMEAPIFKRWQVLADARGITVPKLLGELLNAALSPNEEAMKNWAARMAAVNTEKQC